MDISVTNGASTDELCAALGETRYDFVCVHLNHTQVAEGALSDISASALHGATSCLGAMTHDGPTSGAAAFAIRDPQGAYGTAVENFEAGARSAAERATVRALEAAVRIGEQPDLIWVSATPGAEEDVISGIEAVVGAEIPIIGGSAADNSISGDWRVFDRTAMAAEGVVISVLFPSKPVSFAYQSGYSPTSKVGLVTKAEGRQILEIDGQPALDVYSAWTGAAVPLVAKGAGSHAILSESTLWPLGRQIDRVGEVPFYLLAHPAVAHEGGAIDLFANVSEGEELTLMNGTKQSLVERAGRVAALARKTGRLDDQPISGALMIYCGGCMLSVQDRIGDVVDGINGALDGAPFLGAFTFGEQGKLLNAGNRHGNLMISCIIFGS
ncbi:MAG: FIST N-terminal domain-containing protein [Pseudomonadota bacterium]